MNRGRLDPLGPSGGVAPGGERRVLSLGDRLDLGVWPLSPVSLAGARAGLAWGRGGRAARTRAVPAPPQLVSQTAVSKWTRSSSISSTSRLIVRVTSLPRSRP